MRKIQITILSLLLFIICVITIFGMLSPRAMGQPAAARLGIPNPAVVAHRGASWDVPEETRPAYLLARELGADYLEADVQRTKDGILIALHDDSLMRTTNIAEIFPDRKTLFVENFTYNELQQLDAGSWFNKDRPERARPAFKGLKIITIEEMLDIAGGGQNKPGLYLETKAASRFPDIEKQLVNLLIRNGWIGSALEHERLSQNMIPHGSQPVRTAYGKGRVIFQSFEAESLARLKILAPLVPRIYLIDSDMARAQGLDKLLVEADKLGHGVGPVGYLGWPWYTGRIHRRRLIAHFYTINSTFQMHILHSFGADGFFTDRPDRLLQFHGRLGTVDMSAYFKKIGY